MAWWAIKRTANWHWWCGVGGMIRKSAKEDQTQALRAPCTGSYHARTARLYTDFGLLTADEATCGEVSDVFVQLTGLGRALKHRLLWQRRFRCTKRNRCAIETETRLARAGSKSAAIVAR